jgi:5'-3' exonuclease
MSTSVLIDGGSFYAKAYFAAQRAAFSARQRADDDGDDNDIAPPTPVEIGAKMMLNILDPRGDRLGVRVDRLLFCWDGMAKREKRRQPKPADYSSVLVTFKQAMRDLFGGAHSDTPLHEADDAIATAIYRLADEDFAYVVTGDKDLQSLCSKNVTIYCLNEAMPLSRQHILDRWGVHRPAQICIALAILGDPSDNVPGVKGWGPKKVREVFSKISPEMDLEQVLQTVDMQLPEKHRAAFYDSLGLTVLDPDVPGVPDPAPISFASPELLRALKFSAVAGRYFQVQRAYEFDEEKLAEFIDGDAER